MSGGSGAERFRSPLRYPGGKGKVANYLKLLILENNLLGCEYIEPYAGGAGAALSLLFEEYVDRIHINDIDPGIAAFWQTVLYDSDWFIGRVRSVDVSLAEWERQRVVQHQQETASRRNLAFSTFFLNRTNRSGIVTGGPIGGTHQSGRWRIDARFNKEDLVRRLQRIARFRNRIVATDLDAKDVLINHASRETLIYADPPYFVRGAELYQNSYAPEDHAEIASLIRSLDAPWVVSYDNVPEINNLYQDCTRVDYSLSYSAAVRQRGSEVMYLAPELQPPDVISPANISGERVASSRYP